MTVVNQSLTPETVAQASNIRIRLERVRIKNDSYKATFENDVVRGFLVSNSPIEEINGTYLEKGSFNGVAKYEHVRKWTIMRCELPEIEELGISAEETYATGFSNESRLQKFYNKAGTPI